MKRFMREMITASDSFSTIDLGHCYAILPSDGSVHSQYQNSGLSITPVEPALHATLAPTLIFLV